MKVNDFYFSILGLQTSYFYRDINLYSPSKYALHAMNAILRDEITGKKENIRVTVGILFLIIK